MATKKRETNFSRSYSDATGVITLSHEDAEIVNLDVSTVSAATIRSAVMRYIADVLANVGNAGLKAEGGTIETATEKINAVLAQLVDGTFPFRNASGTSGLSLEEEMQVIAEAVVALGSAATVEEALTKVKAVHAITKVNSKGQTTRPDYRALCNVAEIKAALAKAEGASAETKVSGIFGKLPAAEAKPEAKAAA